MRLRWSETGCLLVVCGLALLPACGDPGKSEVEWWDVTAFTLPCTGEPDHWYINVRPFDPFVELQVGSSVECYLVSGGSSCRDLIASVEWEATVPGIVSFAPGPELYEATLTADAPGTTRIRAEVTHLSGRVVTARSSERPPDIIVVPASEE